MSKSDKQGAEQAPTEEERRREADYLREERRAIREFGGGAWS